MKIRNSSDEILDVFMNTFRGVLEQFSSFLDEQILIRPPENNIIEFKKVGDVLFLIIKQNLEEYELDEKIKEATVTLSNVLIYFIQLKKENSQLKSTLYQSTEILNKCKSALSELENEINNFKTSIIIIYYRIKFNRKYR